jgi:hypothetical protein
MYPVDRTDLCNLCAKTAILELKYKNNPSALQKADQQDAFFDRLILRRTNDLIRADYNSFLSLPPIFEGLVLSDFCRILHCQCYWTERQLFFMRTGRLQYW